MLRLSTTSSCRDPILCSWANEERAPEIQGRGTRGSPVVIPSLSAISTGEVIKDSNVQRSLTSQDFGVFSNRIEIQNILGRFRFPHLSGVFKPGGDRGYLRAAQWSQYQIGKVNDYKVQFSFRFNYFAEIHIR